MTSNDAGNVSFNTFAFDILADYAEINNDTAIAPPEQSAIDAEMQQYLEEPFPSINTNILTWWSERRAKFPMLSLLARFIFSIPPSSAAPEQNLSAAGHADSKKRAQLPTSIVEEILICSGNMDLMDNQLELNE